MDKKLRVFLFVAIVVGWGAFYIKVMLDGSFRIDFYLPSELCNFMQLIILYAVITNRVKILDVIMYPAILGPIAALYYPFGIATFGPFYEVYFYFYHFTLIFVGMYRLVQRKGDVNTNNLKHSIVFMVICAMVASFVNFVTGGNYMFLSESIFETPINYQVFLVLFTLACLTVFHFIIVICRYAIVFCRSLVQNIKNKYKMKKQTNQVKA